MEIHWNILDKKRKDILPLLKNFSEDGFYLAGGTGLALLFGHRDSEDFDFFKEGEYDTEELVRKLESVFKGHKFLVTLIKKNTVYCEIDDDIHLSFLSYNYKMMKPLIKTEYFDIASVDDIACMKLAAASSRTVEKDYVDLYFISQKMPLKDMIDNCLKKYPVIDESVILKSLLTIHDVEREDIGFTKGNKISLEKIGKHLAKLVQEYVRQKQLEAVRKNQIEKDKDIER